MELRDTILGRRSIRSFRPDPVPEDPIEELLELAKWMPSAGNLQDWFVYVVKDPEVRRVLAVASFGQAFVVEAPVVVVVYSDLEGGSTLRGERNNALHDTGHRCVHLRVHTTCSRGGLGTCWVGVFDEDGCIREILAVPDHSRPVAIIPVGYPTCTPPPPPRERVRKKNVLGIFPRDHAYPVLLQ